MNQLWGLSSFSKSSKYDADVSNGEKIWEKILGFGENIIWTDFAKHSLLPR